MCVSCDENSSIAESIRLDMATESCFTKENEKGTGSAAMRHTPVNHPDAMRLVIELSSLYVACDDCGHSRVLSIGGLRRASELGVHNYMQLCRKIRCSECPKAPPAYRNLTIRPTWIEEAVTSYTVA